MKRVIVLGVFIALAHFCAPVFAAGSTSGRAFVGEWNGVAGDDQVDEQWRVSNVDGKWAVFGFYFWNEKGMRNDPGNRVVGDLAGRFKGTDVEFSGGVLRFTQLFDPKPLSNWADTTRIEARVVNGVLVFGNQYVKGVKLNRRTERPCKN